MYKLGQKHKGCALRARLFVKGKIFAAFGMLIIGASVVVLISFHTSQAQTALNGPIPLEVSDIDSVNGMSTNNPLANYPAGNSNYPGQEVSFDNEGISIFMMQSADSPIKTDITGPECGHLGVQSWQGANYAYKLSDANAWQKRQSTCSGIVVIGSSGQIRAQTLTIKGTSKTGNAFTLNVNVPDAGLWDREVGGGSRRLYVDNNGGTYACYGANFTRVWPNECEYSPAQALQKAPVAQGRSAIAGDGLCQPGEGLTSVPSDCVDTVAPVLPAGFIFTAVADSSGTTPKVNLNWSAATDNAGVTGYKIYRNNTLFTTVNTADTPSLSHVDLAPSVGSTYTYYLKAFDLAGNESTASNSVTVTVPFPNCTKLALTLNKTTFTRGENLTYTYTCSAPIAAAPIATAIMQVVKPDGIATTYNTATNISNGVGATMGFETSNFSAGTYTLRVCMETACPVTNTTAVIFTVTESLPPPSTAQCGAGTTWCSASGARTAGCYATCDNNTTTVPPTTVVPPITTVPPTVTPVPVVAPTSGNPPNPNCANGATCAPGSQCSNGQKCNYSDGQITCVEYNTATASTAGAYAATMVPPSCPGTSSPCEITDRLCHTVKEGAIPYVSGGWCWGSMNYFSTDGNKMVCVTNGSPVPVGYSSCRPDDKDCVPEKSYGPYSGHCSMGMKCNQTATDDNPNNDIYCMEPMMGMMGSMEMASCPAGYSMCEKNSSTCHQKGESWTAAQDTANSFYCMNAQICRNGAAGGGTCVGWNETCPSGTLYCNSNDTNCIEPDSYKSITAISSTNGYNNYWCGGGAGMTFYSATQAYCPAKKSSGIAPMSMMWTADEIKAILNKLGSGWGMCPVNDSKCGEPGEAVTDGWCAWWPPNYTGPNYTAPGVARKCPVLLETAVEIKKEQPKEEPAVCLQVLTSAFNATTGECKVFNNSCIPAGWRAGACEPKVEQKITECGPGELPGSTGKCRLPYYKLNIENNKCVLEKCDLNNPATTKYFEIKGDKQAKVTRCVEMAYDIEKDWRQARCKARPPVEYGVEYWVQRDSTAPTLKYDPLTDKLVACDQRENVLYTTASDQAKYSRCENVPFRDQEWYLLQARASYQMNKLYRELFGAGGVIVQPVAPIITVPEVPAAQCSGYLTGVRLGLNGDKQYWKDLNSQASQIPLDYPDIKLINDLLNQSKDSILQIEKLLKKGNCTPENLVKIEVGLNKLRTETFTQLSSYMPDIQEYVQFGYCLNGLGGQKTQLQKLLVNKELSVSKRALLKDLLQKIEDGQKELSISRENGDFDVAERCQNFSGEMNGEAMPLLREYDVELNRIIDDVIANKLDSMLNGIAGELADRQKKVDELLVQVAELHKKVEELSAQVADVANKFTDKLTVSYTALARIEDKFETQKIQIQAAKESLTSLVQQAIETINTKSCVAVADKTRVVDQFGTLAAVNWVDRAEVDSLTKRLNLFIASCNSKSVASADISTFAQKLDEAEKMNLQLSYEQGITPFPDVPTHVWYYGGMAECYRRGCMTQGLPAENALRQDALLMLLRESGASDSDIVGSCGVVAGVYVSDYAACAVKYAIGRGLALTGDMKTPVLRQEIALWVERLQLVPNAAEASATALQKYVDVGGLAAEYSDAIRFVVTNGTMVGQVGADKSMFEPYAPLTRAALSVVLEHIRGTDK